MTPLERAAAELERGRPETAVTHLLDAWQQVRSEAIADALETTSRLVKRRPLGRGSLKAMDARWHEVEAQSDPADVPRLLAGLTSGQIASTLGRVTALARRPDDPRIASALVELYEAPRFRRGAGTSKLLAAVSALLERIGDRRSLARLERATLPEARDAAERVRAAAAGRSSAVSSAAETAALARVTAHLDRTRSADVMLAAVYETPEDDVPRAVYGDWLAQRGDPRGELIQLQLAPTRTPKIDSRIAELLKRHGRAWCGPLAAVTAAKERVFRRGFLADCSVDVPNSRTWTAALSAREWSTVEGLRVSGFVDPSDGFLHRPPFGAIRSLRGLVLSQIESLAGQPPLPLHTLGINVHQEELAGVSRALSPAWLPECRTLGIDSHVDPSLAAPLLMSSFGARLSRLEVSAFAPAVPGWVTAVAATSITTLVIRPAQLTLQRAEPQAPWRELSIPVTWWDTWGAAGADILDALRAASGPLRVHAPASSRKGLSRFLARRTRNVDWY